MESLKGLLTEEQAEALFEACIEVKNELHIPVIERAIKYAKAEGYIKENPVDKVKRLMIDLRHKSISTPLVKETIEYLEEKIKGLEK